MQNDIEIVSDGRVVWINGPDGCNIGRFSRMGIDIHHTAEAQIKGGRQCLDCKAGPCVSADWENFKTGMRILYGVHIDDCHMPRTIRS